MTITTASASTKSESATKPKHKAKRHAQDRLTRLMTEFKHAKQNMTRAKRQLDRARARVKAAF
jgi:hypothetical protein